MVSPKLTLVPVPCTCGKMPELVRSGVMYQLVCKPCKRYALQSVYQLPAYKAWNKKIGDITGHYEHVKIYKPSYFQENKPGYVNLKVISKKLGYRQDRIYHYLTKHHPKDFVIENRRTWIPEGKVDKIVAEVKQKFEQRDSVIGKDRMHLFTDDFDTVIAHNTKHADEVWEYTTGDAHESDKFPWTMIPDDKLFSIFTDALNPDWIPVGAKIRKLQDDEYASGMFEVEMTAKARNWAKCEKYHNCILCTTEW